MRNAVLADTGPLYAAVDRDDAYHGQAQEELGRLEHEGRRVVVAYPTLLECYTLILRRLGFSVAHTWLGRRAPWRSPRQPDCRRLHGGDGTRPTVP